MASGSPLNGDHDDIRRLEDANDIYFISTDLSLTRRDFERRCLDILRQARRAVDVPTAVRIVPYFSSIERTAAEVEPERVIGADTIAIRAWAGTGKLS